MNIIQLQGSQKMRYIIQIAFLLFCISANAAQQNPVTVPEGPTKGDVRTAINGNFSKAKNNDDELYGWVNQGVKTTDNPAFASVHASGGNLAAANKQVTKAWMSSASVAYTADVTSVIHGGHHWICKLSNTSNAAGAEPGVGGSWTTYWKYSGEVIDASGFNGNLATTDDTLQEVAQKVDDLVISGTDDQTASEVPFTPNGSIAATNVQTAIQEVRDEAGTSESITDATISTTDVTTNDASTTKHGWAPKATAPASTHINMLGIGNGETVYTMKPLFDATSPTTQAFGDTAVIGTATVPARRDHKHEMMAAPTPTSLGLLIGTNTQAYDADLTTWAGITPGTNVGTFIATPTASNFFTAVTGEGAFATTLFGYAERGHIVCRVRRICDIAGCQGTAKRAGIPIGNAG